MAQLGKTADHPRNSFPEESYAIDSSLLQQERDPRPLGAAISALGHMDNPLAIPLITEYQTHSSAEIRFDVAFALGCFPNDPKSMSALLLLMEDADEDVRDWATFGLGVLGDLDSAEIRDALFRRLSDPDEDVREEARVGLGKRRDQRVVPFLISVLERPPVTDRVIEATYEVLEMKKDREGWGTEEYLIELRKRFGC